MANVINTRAIDAGDMSSATLTSAWLPLANVTNVCVQAVYTGSPNGTLKLQASNDASNATDISGKTIAIAAAGNGILELTSAGYAYLRVVYTKSSGTGSLTVTVNGK